mgnify:CR=1 FL=1
MAVLLLDSYIDVHGESAGLQSHVKPACGIYKSPTPADLMIGNNRCFVAGWGLSKNMTNEFSLANILKYTKVEILDPEECRDGIPGDNFLAELSTDDLSQIICARVSLVGRYARRRVFCLLDVFDQTCCPFIENQTTKATEQNCPFFFQS